MKIRDLMKKFSIDLNLNKYILDYEIDGEYDTVDIKEYDNNIFYIIEGKLRKVILSETYEYALTYETYVKEGYPPHSISFNQQGYSIAIS